MHVVGTAGHVDHGKSSLVRALTGTDPDRWLEERLRGMTLDLGFAHLRLGDGLEAGVVDVPGHERFLHNMLAGAAGMEVLLLVVDAAEGPRPQTFEHLAILSYLNVRRVIVAANKIDLIPEEDRAAALSAIEEKLRGTLAAGAPLVAVSAQSGEGLDALRAALEAALRDLPARGRDAPAYLPIDRVFALPGHGTIVTGTLMQGRIAVGDRVRLTPLGREVRVRGLQVFGAPQSEVVGGARVAANLHGVEVGEIARGAVLASPQLEARDAFAVHFAPIAGALERLRRKMPVRAYIGSAEMLGTLVFERVPDSLEPVAATLRLRAPTVVVPGEPFVVRRLSPKDLLGGGRVASAAAGDDVEGVDGDRADAETESVAVALHAAGLSGANAERLGAAANVRTDVAQAALEALREAGRALAIAKPDGFVDAQLANELFAHVDATLEESQQSRPWLLGVTSLALSRKLGVAEAMLARLLFALADDGRIANRAGYFATPGFSPSLSAEQRELFETALAASADVSSNIPVTLDSVLAAIRASRIEGLSQALDTLLASGSLTKVGADLYRRSQIVRIRAALESFVHAHGSITPAQFRDVTGTSRKYAVPLLEWFDATGVTLRSGDARVLRNRAAASVPQGQ